jgi:hypothetical protein
LRCQLADEATRVFQRAEQLLESLGVPSGHELIGAIAMGYGLADEAGRSAGRARREDVIHRGGWHGQPRVTINEPID